MPSPRATVLLLLAGVYGAWDLTLWIIKNGKKTGDAIDTLIRHTIKCMMTLTRALKEKP